MISAIRSKNVHKNTQQTLMLSFREGVKAGLDERDAQRQAAELCRKQPYRPEPKLCGQRFRRPWEMRVTLGDTITGHKQGKSETRYLEEKYMCI